MPLLSKIATRRLALSLLVFSLVGCAGAQRRESILESSGSRPEWVATDKEHVTREGREFYRGLVDRQRSLDMAMTRARFAAIGKITETVMLEVRSAFGETTDGVSNDIDNPSSREEGGAIKREIAAISKGVKLSGVVQEGSYWEKYTTTTNNGEEVIAYKVYAVVSIPAADLKRAQRQALEGGLALANRARNEQARASLSDALKSLESEE